MPKRIAVNTLQASTIDILNTIRANASAQYQAQVPAVVTRTDIPKVGEVLYGYPAFANEFLSALMNRIALVRVKSATFNNAYSMLKKGYLEFGETVEEVFVSICKAREFSAEKAESRELKRSLPDVRTAFHTMNWRVQYPVTIQDEDLRMAFLSADGVTDLIAKIIDSVLTAAEYDEFLLFKYLIIKAVAHGKMYPVSLGADIKSAAVAFRGSANMITFMSNKYNASGVHTTTPKDSQYIFMDAMYNADFDVNVLASAFNMDKADFMGRLFLIDDFTTFDNDRFSDIMAGSDMIELVTAEELALMGKVKAVLVDGEWFQVYDNQAKFTEKYVASGEYWNYFYNVWKTVSSSPFSNAIVFVDNSADVAAPATFTVKIDNISTADTGTVVTLLVDSDNPSLASSEAKFVQTEQATKDGIAVHPYGAIMFPPTKTTIALEMTVKGVKYTGAAALNTATAEVGGTITMNKVG